MTSIARSRIFGAFVTLGLISIFLHFLCVPLLHADPVWGELFNLKQPNGEIVEVRIWGDEFYRVVESLDGFTLVRDPASGVICYARLSADGNSLVSTGVAVHNASGESLGLETGLRINPEASRAIIQEKRMEAMRGERRHLDALGIDIPTMAPPDNGNVKGICLIVDFSDAVATIPASNIDDYCNMVGYTGYGNNGSVRDYFYDVSDGNLTYTNHVPTTYYRAQYPKSYYDDCVASYGQRARELVLEALNNLEANGFDFSQYDSNSDGLIDAINCFYAGVTGCAWAQGLWPHSWTVSFSADGVSAFKYQITGIGSSLRLSTFCHENGHMICYWPDLYDYDGDSRGVGRFCLMCSYTSSTNPQEPCAYLKYASGWTTTHLLTSPQCGTVPSDTNIFYKYNHPTNSNEFYMIENRQKAGRDLYLPDDGIAIWHIDTAGNNSDQDMTPTLHYLVTLVQADGNWDLEYNVNSGDATDLWANPGYVECTPLTTPNTNWWSGSSSSLSITNISNNSSLMTFNFNSTCPADPTSLDFAGVPLGCFKDLSFTIYNTTGGMLNGDVTEACDHFSIVAGGGMYSLSPGESLLVTVRFEPTVMGSYNCTIETGGDSCCDVMCSGEGLDGSNTCDVYPKQLNFGSIAMGDSVDLDFKIHNIGCSTLNGTVTESCLHYGIVQGGGAYSLAPGDSQVVTIRYKPTLLGTWYCTIQTGTGCSNVSCEGISFEPPPACLVEPDTLDFGNVEVAGFKMMTFDITNTGYGTLSGTMSDACPYFDVVSGGTYSLTHDQSQTVTVIFFPGGAGPHTCTIDTGNNACTDLYCMGYGGSAAPECFVDPDTLDFGTVLVGNYDDLDFFITNTGGGTLSGTVAETCDHY
ncbi:MAG: M6 family metalloprotease domain-containing protein, partial [Candidatus Latescibacterota bacterium]